ncbi:hypothetical protein [Clostridium intestinale]|uniref:hypothetical protein n=1 Tax=Clostridium intestinale TaxID=36845 RepID=UPI0028E286F4|nr:hypothetical protein [Clostridium intestinale]
MKVGNLKVAQRVKDYKKMCTLLEEKIKGGDSKKAQLKEWERYFKYHKDGNAFVIDEIYKSPKDKEDNRINNGGVSIYAEDLEKLIIHMMSKSQVDNYKQVQLSVSTMLRRLAMINHNFNIGRNNINKFSRYLEVPIETLFDFYNNTYKKIKDNVERTLDKLENEALIKWQYVIKLCTNEGVYRSPTDRELSVIVETEREHLELYKEKSKKDLFLHGKWNTWQKDVNESLLKSIGVLYYFKCFNIITTTSFQQMLLAEADKEDIEITINSNVKESCISTAEKTQERFKNKYLGSPRINKEKNRVSKDYIEDTKQIVKICIDKYNPILLKYELEDIENKKYTYSESENKQYSVLKNQLLDEIFG